MKVDARMMKRVRIDPKPVAYQRLDGEDESKGEHVGVPKGYVPVLVGWSEERMERFVIHIKLFKHPCMLALLKMAEEEFGYEQPGVLNIPCDVGFFQRVIDMISTSKAK